MYEEYIDRFMLSEKMCEYLKTVIDFYENEAFRLFGERISENDGKRYLQYMRFF